MRFKYCVKKVLEVYNKSEFQVSNQYMKKLKYQFLKFSGSLASSMQFKKCFPSLVYCMVLLSVKKQVLNFLHFSV